MIDFFQLEHSVHIRIYFRLVHLIGYCVKSYTHTAILFSQPMKTIQLTWVKGS